MCKLFKQLLKIRPKLSMCEHRFFNVVKTYARLLKYSLQSISRPIMQKITCEWFHVISAACSAAECFPGLCYDADSICICNDGSVARGYSVGSCTSKFETVMPFLSCIFTRLFYMHSSRWKKLLCFTALSPIPHHYSFHINTRIQINIFQRLS